MNIEAYLTAPEICEYALLPTGEIPFSPMVSELCKENRCGRYGTCWTCPPGVGTREEWQERVRRYETACVFTCKYDLEDSFDLDGMMEGQATTKRVLHGILDRLAADGETVLALGCEGCSLCETCSYPDAPCRFPDKAVPSVEACGIYVVELAKKAGVRYHNGPDTVTYFCMILFG